jgi:hypothetical protein
MSGQDDNDPSVATDEDDEPATISTYTRAEALVDGVLIDVSQQAKEAGIQIPTAVTRAVWNDYVELTPAAIKAGNDIEGRSWDIVWMFRRAALANRNEGEIHFQVYVVTGCIEPSPVTLKALIQPGDDGKPVITISLPDED